MPYSLEECWTEWIAKAREFSEKDVRCCAPFFSFKPDGYDQFEDRLLLVGKATDGWPWKDDLDQSSGLSDHDLAVHQREESSNFRKERAASPKRHPGFWEFEQKLASRFGDTSTSRQNLIWSNLYKIGRPNGNPSKRIAECQQGLAIKTLRTEIVEYRPTLVVFANLYAASFYDDAVYETAGSEYRDDWIPEHEGKSNESWALTTSSPPMLWIRHPGRKSNRTFEAWIDRAEGIARSSRSRS
jgi:hypothetical protein